jgi:hypothetical protein
VTARVDDVQLQMRRTERNVAIERWRRHYDRDLRAFQRVHGRPPATHYELAHWLAGAA